MEWAAVLLLFFGPWGAGGAARHLSESQRRYLEGCPHQTNLSLACNPGNIDGFMAARLEGGGDTRLEGGGDIKAIISKAFIPGACYRSTLKYCPVLLASCHSKHNYGNNWTVQGICVKKASHCPDLVLQEVCAQRTCGPTQYLCHPRGCLPMMSHCNGHCPMLPHRPHRPHRANSSLAPPPPAPGAGKGGRVPTRRFLCGNSCLTKDEARNKYHCGGSCQVKSEPCRAPGETVCPQHFTLCGADTCIDRFVQDKAISATGFPEYYSCQGFCTHSSLPCPEPSNESMSCPLGHWLCDSQLQCVLEGIMVRDELIPYLCDGQLHCRDGSDESLYQCFQVNMALYLSYLAGVVLGLPALLLLLLLVARARLDLSCTASPSSSSLLATVAQEDKSFHRNEDEMDLRAVAPEDVD